MTTSDADSFMWWRIGDWMLNHHQIIHTEIFSHTRFDTLFITKEWLAGILYAAAGTTWGLYGFVLVAATAIATAFALLHRQLLREGSDPFASTLVVLLAAWASSCHWMARPHVFSFLLILFAHTFLRDFQRGGPARTMILKLTLLTILWVNLHGGFIAVLFLTGAHWLGAIIERNRQKTTALSLALLFCAIACLVNPNGWNLPLHNLQFLSSKYLTGWVTEFRSPNFHSADLHGFIVWLALTFIVLAVLRPKLSPADAIVLIMWTGFALQMMRNIPLTVIVAAPILTPAISEWVRARWILQLPKTNGWPILSAALAVAVFIPRPVEVSTKDWPVDAVRFIRKSNLTGNMFNQYMWGSYLLHELPEHKVFIDSREDFYGEPFLREFDATAGLNTNWTAALVKYDVRWTLMPTSHRLNQALAASGWHCLYSNDVAMIYRKPE